MVLSFPAAAAFLTSSIRIGGYEFQIHTDEAYEFTNEKVPISPPFPFTFDLADDGLLLGHTAVQKALLVGERETRQRAKRERARLEMVCQGRRWGRRGNCLQTVVHSNIITNAHVLVFSLSPGRPNWSHSAPVA